VSAPRAGRRRILRAGGVAVAVLASGCSLVPPIPKRPQPRIDDLVGWVRLDSDGRLRLWCPRMEMGQQVVVALRAVLAAAVGVPPSAVDAALPATGSVPAFKATVGSDSIRELAGPVALAGRSLRDALLGRAAERLGVPVEALRVETGQVTGTDGRRLTWQALATPPLRQVPSGDPAAALRSLRAALPAAIDATPELLAIVTGAALFAADVRLPGMVHATVLRSPWAAEHASPLAALDEAAVRAAPGFVALVRDPALSGPAVVGERPGVLDRLRTAAAARWIRPPDLDTAAFDRIDVDRALAEGRLTRAVGAAPAQGPWDVDLRLDVPMAAHASIEPRCAVARITDGRCEIWCGTQDPHYVRDVIARDLGLPADRVVVHPMRIGGGFGGRTIATVEREAARLARATGRPVKVQWRREDEFVGAFHRPPASHRIRLRLDEDGRITQWWHALSSSHVLFSAAVLPPWLQRLTERVGDAGTTRGQVPPYAIGASRLDLTLTRLPVATGPWRGLGAGPNVIAIESAMDAAARTGGHDPVRFRLDHLPPGQARLAHCLRRVVERAGGLRAGAAGRARGVACGLYKDDASVAVVAEVSVTRDGRGAVSSIGVERLWCVHDCGMIVDPDTVRAQVAGNLAWTIGMVLLERLTAPDGTPAQTTFADYPILRHRAMPALDIDLVDSDAPPAAAGETAIVAGAAAILNALAAATGVRPERLPVAPGDLDRV